MSTLSASSIKTRLSRRAARLAFVQSSYAGLFSQAESAGWDCALLDERAKAFPTDQNFLALLRSSRACHAARINQIFADCVTQSRMPEPILQAILEAGITELIACGKNTDPPLIISEYVAIASAFFSSGPCILVNGVLDTAARRLCGPLQHGGD